MCDILKVRFINAVSQRQAKQKQTGAKTLEMLCPDA